MIGETQYDFKRLQDELWCVHAVSACAGRVRGPARAAALLATVAMRIEISQTASCNTPSVSCMSS